MNTNCLAVLLFNTRFLRRHLQDILKYILMENVLLCLAEIQVCHENDVSDIKQQLDTYEVHLNVEDDRYQIIGFCLLSFNEYEKLPGLSIFEIVKDSFCPGTVQILLVYRNLNSSLRGCRQITFVTLNRFCSLSKTPCS